MLTVVPVGNEPCATVTVTLAEPKVALTVVDPVAVTCIEAGTPNADVGSPDGGGAFVGPIVEPPPPPPPPLGGGGGGGAGAVGVTALEVVEKVPVPAALVAATVKT
jgi:hypothetical protein